MGSKSRSFPEIFADDILPRLPVKSIVRFKSLSTSSTALIRSSAFSAAQIRHSSDSGRRALLLARHRHFDPPQEYDIVLIRESVPTVNLSLAVPSLPGAARFPRIAGSCNGLVCLDFSPGDATHLAVWNPATREFRAVPVHPVAHFRQIWKSAIGFGFDPESGDFRVLRVLQLKNEGGGFGVFLGISYSLRNGCWSEVMNARKGWVLRGSDIAVSAMGALHWIGQSDTRFILSFVLPDQVFVRLDLPPPYDSASARMNDCLKLIPFEKTYALAVYSQFPDLVNFFDLWVLREDRWCNLFHSSPLDSRFVPMVFWRGTEFAMTRPEPWAHILFSFDPVKRKVGELYYYMDLDSPVDVVNYIESVASVYNGVEDEEQHGAAEPEPLPLAD